MLFRVLIALCLTATSVIGQPFKSPDILVLGDSQIMFGAGPAYLDFFDDLVENCPSDSADADLLYELEVYSTAVIGVRSTSIHNWSAQDDAGKADICDIDPNFDRNAGAYGTVNQALEKYIQIGQDPEFAFCQPEISPLKSALRPDYYAPKLLVLSFLGNATERWGASLQTAKDDVDALLAEIPTNLPCVFLTTAPSFKTSINTRRAPAQQAIETAFAAHGNRCSFVRGSTQKTKAILQADKNNFRLNAEGDVKDPFHPTYLGASRFLNSIRPELCSAVISSLKNKRR